MSLFTEIHPSWKEFFNSVNAGIESVLTELEGEEYNPAPELVFRFARTDLNRIRVIILGQDPYPQPGAATGRSFEVAGLSSWAGPIRQSSLRNIIRAVYAAYTGEKAPWGEVRNAIADGSFKIAPPDRLWDELEAQGVLFLNAYLTCQAGEPLSHKHLWRDTAQKLVTYIDSRRGAEASWFLWGADARSYGDFIKQGRRYESRHPMMTGHAPDDFLTNPCFRETMRIVNWTGKTRE